MSSPIVSPYYLRRPRTWQRNLAKIDARSFVCLEHGYLCMRVPKAANSTVLATLLRSRPVAGLSWETLDRSKFHGRHLSDLRRAELGRLDGLFVFAVVRNPYHRALSAYLDKFRAGKVPQRLFGARVAAMDAGRASFRGFCRYLAAGGEAENAHWMRQTRLTGVLPRLDFVGRVETLAADLATILARIGVQEPGGVLRAGPASTGASARVAEFLDDECREILARVYAEDFSGFGYAA